MGLANNGQYKYNITLVKENGLWKIDDYLLDDNNTDNSWISNLEKEYKVIYNNSAEENFGSEELGKKFIFKVYNGYLIITDINNNSYKLENISNIKSILLLSPTSIDSSRLFVLTTDKKVYAIENIYYYNYLEDINSNIIEIKFDGKVEELGYTKDYVSPPISNFLVLKTNYGEYLFNSTSYDNYILINSSNYDKIYNIGNIIITLKNNFLAIRDINQKKLIDEEIKISSIDDISTIDYHEYLPTNSSTLKKDKNIIDIYLYCKEDSCDSAFILYQYNVSNKTLSKYNNK